MSRYEWESGTIKIPTRSWVPLKKVLRETFNAQREEVKRQAESVQRALEAAHKGKRNVEHRDVEGSIRKALAHCPDELYEEAESLVRASIKKDHAWRTNKITEGMLSKVAGPKATNKSLAYSGSDWTICLNDMTRSVYWGVDENNNAVERARESRMGSTLFRELGRIDYGKRKEMGGVIVGNNECNRDDGSVGGGGNYVAAAFGLAGERAQFGRLGRAC